MRETTRKELPAKIELGKATGMDWGLKREIGEAPASKERLGEIRAEAERIAKAGRKRFLAAGAAAIAVSWRIGREAKNGKTAFSARAQWLEREPEAKDWGLGALGADINAWGIAWAAAKSDGNLARPAKGTGETACFPKRSACFGSIPVSWGETSEQATHAARHAALALVDLAKDRGLPIVLEDLDFSAKKRSLRYEEGTRAKALSGFAYRKLIESIRARAAKEGVPVRFACPSWTSVMGFAKYGRRNGLSPDQAAALAIARKGLGLKGTTERAVRRGGEKILVLNRPERI